MAIFVADGADSGKIAAGRARKFGITGEIGNFLAVKIEF